MITLFMVLLMTKWADISGERDLFFQNVSKISHFASLPSKQTSLNSEVGCISQRNLQGCYDRQGISTVRLGNSDNWQHHCIMFVSHPPSWKHFKPSRNSGFVVLFLFRRGFWLQIHKLNTTGTNSKSLLDPTGSYDAIWWYRRFPTFLGLRSWGCVRKVDSWAEESARRPRLLEEWLWMALGHPRWRCDAAHTCTYMGHGSTWIYMDVHGNFPNLMFVYRETLMPDLRTRHATCESKDVSSQSETRCCDIVGNFTIWRSDKWS